MNVTRFGSRDELDAALAERLKQAIGGEAVMLSGGHAPRPAYHLLGLQSLPSPTDLRVLYSDERYVPPTSEASNYRASIPFLKALALPDEHVLRVCTEFPLEQAAVDYDERLRALLESGARVRLGLLGLGADGHTASLFSPADLERASNHLAIAVQRPDGMNAVTVTPSFLTQVEHVLMVVIGAEKRQALAALLAKDPGSIAWRAVERCKSVEVWFVRTEHE